MSFISYAQNFEDVILWRALKHVEHGFYIDIGAWSPDLHSVTRAFYERGWRGINIEPYPEFNRQLQKRRPHDRNLRVAVGDREGVLAMNFLSNSGLSTLVDAIAEKHLQAGWSLERQEVQVTTLAAIWQEHVPAGQAVHFLKVDVEGFEEAALKGNDWEKNRPWVVVVEATLPMSHVESHEDWEPILINEGYQLAYADGLNRFYVAQEHSELLPAFKYPPNVFDGFKLVGQHEVEAHATQAEAQAQQAEVRAMQAEAQAQQAEVRAMQAEAQAQQAEARATQAEAQAQQAEVRATQAEAQAQQAEARATQAEAKAQQAEAHVNDLLSSTSWRITAPLRRVAGLTYRLKPRALKSKLKPFLKHAALYVGRRPKLKRMVLVVLGRFPGLKFRLLRVVQGSATAYHAPAPNVPTELAHLSPRARQVYADLRTAIDNNKRID